MSMTVEEFAKAMENGIEIVINMKTVASNKTCLSVRGNQDLDENELITVLECALSGLTGIGEEEIGDAIRDLMEKHDEASDCEVDIKEVLDGLFSSFEEAPVPVNAPKPKVADAFEEFLDFVRNGKKEDVEDFKKLLREAISELK